MEIIGRKGRKQIFYRIEQVQFDECYYFNTLNLYSFQHVIFIHTIF